MHMKRQNHGESGTWMMQMLAYGVHLDNDQLALHPRVPSLHSSVLHWYLSVLGPCPPAWTLCSGVWVSSLCQPQFWPILCQFLQGSWSQSKSGRGVCGLGPVWGIETEARCQISQASTHTAAFILLSRGWALGFRKPCLAFYEPLIRAAMWLAEFLEVNSKKQRKGAS